MSEKLKPAEQEIIEQLSGLCAPGRGFVPVVPTTPIPPAPEPIIVEDPNERRLLLLLADSTPLVRNEIAAGLNIERQKADALLERLVAAGKVLRMNEDGLIRFTAMKPAPVVVQPVPVVDRAEEKVLAFLKICRVKDGLTYREISGGTTLPISGVQRALDSLVKQGIVKHSGGAESESNRRLYSLTIAEPEPIAPVPYVNPDVADSAAAQQREREKQKLLNPDPPLKKPIALEDVVLPEPAKPLSPEEIREYELMHKDRRGAPNPQAFIKG